MNLKTIVTWLCLMFVMVIPSYGQIQTKQSIKITVTGVPLDEKGRVDAEYPVGENGAINMPYIGTVQAAGLRPEVLATILQERYKAHGIYRNPTFQVFSTASGSSIVEQVVNVGGCVRRTGPVKYVGGLTLWSAIQAAGGPTEFGAMNRVTLTRNGKTTEYNCNETKSMQIQLQPEDAINVPQKNWIGK